MERNEGLNIQQLLYYGQEIQWSNADLTHLIDLSERNYQKSKSLHLNTQYTIVLCLATVFRKSSFFLKARAKQMTLLNARWQNLKIDSSILDTKRKNIWSLHISKAQATAELPRSVKHRRMPRSDGSSSAGCRFLFYCQVCNLYLNQKGFYGDEDIEGFWPRAVLRLLWDRIQTLSFLHLLSASSVM